jgi:multiple sugar transport system permease protein
VKKPALAQRLTFHVLLAAGSAVFLFPLLWLVSTSLKPVEQAMHMPPVWGPRADYAPVDGRELRIIKDHALSVPGIVVRLPNNEKRLVGPEEIKDNTLQVAVVERAVRHVLRMPVVIVKEVPAGWWYVSEWFPSGVRTHTPAWDCVPETAIRSVVAPAWRNYRDATTRIPFWRYAWNTLVVCVLGTLGTVVSCALAAYGLSRIPWRGREPLFYLTLATMMVPFPVTMITLYGIFKHLGWIGTLLPLWLPSWFGGAFSIFLLRQFFRTIPDDLLDAARIDGCSEFGIFWRVVVPLSRPALAVVALFHFMYAWRDFLGPLLFLTKQDTFTLSLGLQFYQSQHGGSEWHLLMAASTLVILPIIVLFFFTQKTFIQGISTTGLK